MPTFPENFMQMRSEVFAQSCKQTDRQTTITYIPGGGNYSAKIPYARFCRLSIPVHSGRCVHVQLTVRQT